MTNSLPSFRRALLALLLAIAIRAFCGMTRGAEPPAHPAIDASKLPPPDTHVISFGRDVQPILERSCLQCHNAQRAKSMFRLDNRKSALQGGENDPDDIVPGNSAKSRLIHYVAALVPDMEMPPKGKGDLLSPTQIGILRAWIDQGVVWDQAEADLVQVTNALTAGGYIVNGNRGAFRELLWKHEGWDGGLARFDLRRTLDERTSLFLDGHALRDDSQVNLKLERYNFGFVRIGLQEYRKYYSGAGGYYPLSSPPVNSFNRDLHLDIGKASIDLGLTLPDWPKMVVGYEFQHRDGEKTTLQWGPLSDPAIGTDLKNVLPALKNVRERLHILKFDLDHEIAGFNIENNFRAEFYNLNTERRNTAFFSPGPGGLAITNVLTDGYKHFQAANTFRIQRQFTDWLFASAGYLFSHLGADGAYTRDTIADPLFVTRGRFDQLIFERDAHVGAMSALLGPWDGLSLFGGVQAEWSRQKGFGRYTDESMGVLTDVASGLDKAVVQENAGLRYTKIPFTVLFAEGRLQQESVGQFEDRRTTAPDADDFLRDTDATSHAKDLRIGFNTSPWRRISFGAHYRWLDKTSRYDHARDQDGAGLAGNPGYSAFIRFRDIKTDEFQLKTTIHPASWIKTTLTCKLVTTDYRTDTDRVEVPFIGLISPGGTLLAGTFDAQTVSLNFALTPVRRLYLSTTMSYVNSRTWTEVNGSPAVVPYKGAIYSAISSATYALSERSDLQLSYLFSLADYGQSNFADGLPVGMKYQQHRIQASVGRRFLNNFSARLQYGFYLYDEPSSGHFNDFTAHSLFATLTMRWP